MIRRIAAFSVALVCAVAFVAKAQLAPDIEEDFATNPFTRAGGPVWCERYNHVIFDFLSGSGVLTVTADTSNSSSECSQYDSPNNYGYNCIRPTGTAANYCTACTSSAGQCSDVTGATETLQTVRDYGSTTDTSRSGTIEFIIGRHLRPAPTSHFALFIARHPLCQMNIEAVLAPTGSDTGDVDPRQYELSLAVQNGENPPPAPTPTGWAGLPSECTNDPSSDPISWTPPTPSGGSAGAYDSDDVRYTNLSESVGYVWVADSSVLTDGTVLLNTRVCKGSTGCGSRNTSTNKFPECSAVGSSDPCAYAQLNNIAMGHVSLIDSWYPSKSRRYMFGLAHPNETAATWAPEDTIFMKVTSFTGC